MIRSSRFYNEPPHNYDEENLYLSRGLTHLISERKERGGHTERMRKGGDISEGWRREEEMRMGVGTFEELRNTFRMVRDGVRRKEEKGRRDIEEDDVLKKEMKKGLNLKEGKREGGGKKDKSWEGYHSERIATAKKMDKFKMEDEMTQRKIRRKLNY